jgi:hypothetical protein
MRLSAIGWSAIGTTVEVGARIRKNQPPRNPAIGDRRQAITTPTKIATMISAYGATASGSVARISLP